MSSARGLRLLNTMELIKPKSTFDAKTVLSKTTFQSANNGELKGTLTIEPAMCNIAGIIHGGFMATVIDAFSSFALLSSAKGKLSVTITMDVVYLRSAMVGETIHVETKPMKIGHSSFIEANIFNAAGDLLAKGTSTHLAVNEKYQDFLKNKFNFDVNEN